MMQFLKIYFFSKKHWIIIFIMSMLICSCAELDGVFPKFEPQKKVDETKKLPTSASVNQKQTSLSEENRILQEKIEKLQNKLVAIASFYFSSLHQQFSLS